MKKNSKLLTAKQMQMKMNHFMFSLELKSIYCYQIPNAPLLYTDRMFRKKQGMYTK